MRKTITIEMDHMWEGEAADGMVVGSIIEIEWKVKCNVNIEVMDIDVTNPQIDLGTRGNQIHWETWKDKRAAESAVRKYMQTREGKAKLLESLNEHLID